MEGSCPKNLPTLGLNRWLVVPFKASFFFTTPFVLQSPGVLKGGFCYVNTTTWRLCVVKSPQILQKNRSSLAGTVAEPWGTKTLKTTSLCSAEKTPLTLALMQKGVWGKRGFFRFMVVCFARVFKSKLSNHRGQDNQDTRRPGCKMSSQEPLLNKSRKPFSLFKSILRNVNLRCKTITPPAPAWCNRLW